MIGEIFLDDDLELPENAGEIIHLKLLDQFSVNSCGDNDFRRKEAIRTLKSYGCQAYRHSTTHVYKANVTHLHTDGWKVEFV